MAKVGKPYLNIPDGWFRRVKEENVSVLESAANAVASSLRSTAKGNGGGSPEVIVSMKKNRKGDPVALVLLAEPNGVAQQVKRGVVTRAAASNGLDVHRYSN